MACGRTGTGTGWCRASRSAAILSSRLAFSAAKPLPTRCLARGRALRDSQGHDGIASALLTATPFPVRCLSRAARLVDHMLRTPLTRTVALLVVASAMWAADPGSAAGPETTISGAADRRSARPQHHGAGRSRVDLQLRSVAAGRRPTPPSALRSRQARGPLSVAGSGSGW